MGRVGEARSVPGDQPGSTGRGSTEDGRSVPTVDEDDIRSAPSTTAELMATKAALDSEQALQRACDQELQAQSELLEQLLGAERGTAAASQLMSRRRILGLAGVGVAGGASLIASGKAGAAPLKRPMTAPVPTATLLSSLSPAADTSSESTIRVAPPTGLAATDMVNILQALKDAKAGTNIVFQTSSSAVYAVDQELPVPRGVRLTGSGVTSESSSGAGAPAIPTLQQAAGTALHCIAGSVAYLNELYTSGNPGKYPQFTSLYKRPGSARAAADSAIEVDHLAFDGQNGGSGSGNTQGHGVVVLSNGSKVHDCYFVNIANAAIVASDCLYDAVPCTNETFENRIQDNTIVNPGWYGILSTFTSGAQGCTDGVIQNNIIVSPAQQQRTSGPNLNPSSEKFYEAIHLANAAGWWVVGNYMQACPGDGAYFNTNWGLHLVDNTVDGFGCYPQARKSYSGYNVATAGQDKTHPGFIIGNLAAGYEIANPFAPSVPAPASATFAYFKLTMQTDIPNDKTDPHYVAYIVEADNVAYQASQLPGPIADATISAGNLNKVSVPQGTTAGVTVGMGITDHLGLIPNGATVKQVTPGTGSNPDVMLLTKGASKATTDDTVSFVGGPTSVAWTYVNDLYDADMQVSRSNETVTGTISATPLRSITPAAPPAGKTAPTITLTDPADMAGGEYLDPTVPPSVGQIIVASNVTRLASTGRFGVANWQTPTSTGPESGVAGGVLAGEFPNPLFSPDVIATVTTSGPFALPAWANRVRITCVGGAGGGGGGATRMGGGGGAAGTAVESLVEVGGEETIEVTIGTGGAGGAGGTSSVAGGNGTAGGATEVVLGSATVTAGGGPGGPGASPGSTGASGAAYAALPGVSTPVSSGGSGGSSGLGGGNPFSYSPGGGGGGGMGSGGQGGGPGGAGTAASGGVGGPTGSSSSSAGGAGETAIVPGAPGGGGGGSVGTGVGGTGGGGSDGFVIIEVIG